MAYFRVRTVSFREGKLEKQVQQKQKPTVGDGKKTHTVLWEQLLRCCWGGGWWGRENSHFQLCLGKFQGHPSPIPLPIRDPLEVLGSLWESLGEIPNCPKNWGHLSRSFYLLPGSLTVRPWKKMVGRWSFPIGKVAFQGRTVKLREGSPLLQLWSEISVFVRSFLNFFSIVVFS